MMGRSLARLAANWRTVRNSLTLRSVPFPKLYSTHWVICTVASAAPFQCGDSLISQVQSVPCLAANFALLVQKSTIPPELFCTHEVDTRIGLELCVIVCQCVCLCVCLPACPLTFFHEILLLLNCIISQCRNFPLVCDQIDRYLIPGGEIHISHQHPQLKVS